MNKIKIWIISNSPSYHILKVLVQYLVYLYLSWNGILLLDHHLHDKNLIYDIGKKTNKIRFHEGSKWTPIIIF